jgi:DNA replication protein DnaC
VLYIDDLGAEPIGGVGVLQWVYERRYAANLATVTTTGLTKALLTDRYGAATVRRMREQHVARGSGGEWPVLVVDLHDGEAR